MDSQFVHGFIDGEYAGIHQRKRALPVCRGRFAERYEMTPKELAEEMEKISNSGREYSHPNDAARLYQVFQVVGQLIGKRMAELQRKDKK